MKVFCRVLLRKLLVLALLTVAVGGAALPQGRGNGEAAAEHHISKQEAQELFRSVDEILKFASEQTGLPILHGVKKKLATREQVGKYVDKRLKEQASSGYLDRTALPLKKLGLLPRDFDLRKYMLDLYKEQVEGWYDPHSKTVYLLDWVAAEAQKPVMAHELVHALQDQNFGLDHWLNIAKDSKDPTVQIALDEQRVARQSVVEGQAMAVLAVYEHESAGGEAAPTKTKGTRPESSTQDKTDPVYAKAPLYVREALLFPYTFGSDFVRVVLAQRGKEAAFAGVFRRPPANTRQVMQPATYLSSEPQPEIKVAPVEQLLGPDWQRVDVSGIGEIDLRVLLEAWGGQIAAASLTAAWNGGYYIALSHKNAPRDAPLSLALIVQFTSQEAARQFAAVYMTALATRYRSVQPASSGAPVISPVAQSDAAPRILEQWSTEEGLVSLYVDGATIVALESFTAVDAARVHAVMVPAPAITISAIAAH